MVSRKDYRNDRNQSIKQVQETIHPRLEFCSHLISECLKPRIASIPMYDFSFCTRRHPCTIYHFQLRHLISCPSAFDVCFVYEQRVKLWNSVYRVAKDLFSANTIGRNTKICTLSTTSSLVLAGGASNEVILHKIYHDDEKSPQLISIGTSNNHHIINHITNTHDETKAMICSNDSTVRFLDLSTKSVIQSHSMAIPMNCSSFHPSDQIYCVVGDDPQGLLCDIRTNQPFATLVGHLDHLFGVDISHDGVYISTGSQDRTTRIYDMRKLGNPSNSLICLHANVGPVRTVKYSRDGSVLAVGESDDFVTLYDVLSGYRFQQTIDFFGETSGMDFAPGTDNLFLGISSYESGGILEFKKRIHRPSITMDNT